MILALLVRTVQLETVGHTFFSGSELLQLFHRRGAAYDLLTRSVGQHILLAGLKNDRRVHSLRVETNYLTRSASRARRIKSRSKIGYT